MSQSPTITSPAMMTGVGVILGTAAYMSPGAGEGPPGGQAQRHLGVRLRALRDADGPTRVRRRGHDRRARRRGAPRAATGRRSRPTCRRRSARCCSSCLVKDRRHRVADISTALFVLDKAASLAAPDGTAVGRAAAPQTAVAARRHAGDRCAGDRRGRGRRRSGSPRARLNRSAACLAPADRRRRGRRADHQRQQLTWRSRPTAPASSTWATRHATLRPRARRPRAGGGVHRRAARAVRLPRWPMDRVRGRRGVLKKVAMTGGPAVTLATLDGATPAAPPGARMTRSSSRPAIGATGLQRVAAGGWADDGPHAARPRAGRSRSPLAGAAAGRPRACSSRSRR